VDRAVVAAAASERRGALTELLDHVGVGRVLLEKFLFDRRTDFEKAQELLDHAGVPAWVHSARGYMNCYSTLASRWALGRVRRMTVTGTGFNLASNGVHLLDLLRWLSGAMVVRARSGPKGLSAIPAGRADCREVLGSLVGETAAGATISINCRAPAPVGLRIRVETDDEWAEIDETGQSWRLVDGAGTEIQSGAQPPHVVSQVTGPLVELLCGLPTRLPTYAESVSAHLALFDVLMPVIGAKDGRLPIT